VRSWHSDVEWIAASIDSDHAARALEGADVVYHLASSTLPSTSNLDMSFDLQANTLGTLRLLNAARMRIGRLIFVSSGGTVYGSPQCNPIPESHPTNPLCAYGIHKLAIEKYLNLFQHLYGLSSITLRVSNIYGEGQDCARQLGAVAHFSDHALKGEPIEIWGDGSIVRDYVHVDDVAGALLNAATYSGTHTLFNIGSGVGTSLNELVELIQRRLHHALKINYKPGRGFDVAQNVLDIRLASAEMNWRPMIGIQAGLERMLTAKADTASGA